MRRRRPVRVKEFLGQKWRGWGRKGKAGGGVGKECQGEPAGRHGYIYCRYL